ncbi:MAG: FRG domain-containing protein [Ignavibacteriaceae bacterium]
MQLFVPKNLEIFLIEFEEYKNSGHQYFRGQADAAWSITPGLARNECNEIYHQIIKIEEKLYSKFKKKVIDENKLSLIPLVSGSYHPTWQWVMSAQHYGLPTRLLDFSHDKDTALEFAVGDLQHLNSDGALFIHNKVKSSKEEEENISALLRNNFLPINKTFFFQAPRYGKFENNEFLLSEKRKTIQGSKFIYRATNKITECLSLDNDHSKWLTKIHIAKELKPQIIEYLIANGRFAFDLYTGKNAIDYYAAILKTEFLNINSTNIDSLFSP